MAYHLTRQEADRLVRMPKHIDEPIRWTSMSGGTERDTFSVRVVCRDIDEPMYLRGVVGRTNWSFLLLTHARIPIRKLTVHGPGHRNPDGTDAGTHHKHVWDDVHEDQETYYPVDIDFTDVNVALIGFLAECNIVPAQPPERLDVRRRLR